MTANRPPRRGCGAGWTGSLRSRPHPAPDLVPAGVRAAPPRPWICGYAPRPPTARGRSCVPTIPGTLRMTARQVPDAEALVFGDVRYTYAELDAAVDRIAAVLRDAGLGKGDRCAIMATNSDRFVLAFYAAMRVGGVVVPVNPALAPPEVAYLLADSGARLLAFHPSLAPTVEAALAADRPPDLAEAFSLGEADGHPDLLARAAAADAEPRGDDVAEDDDALI